MSSKTEAEYEIRFEPKRCKYIQRKLVYLDKKIKAAATLNSKLKTTENVLFKKLGDLDF